MRMDTTGMLKSLFMSGQNPTSGGNATVFEISPRLSLLDSCHKKIRLIGGAPVAFLGGLVAPRSAISDIDCGPPLLNLNFPNIRIV
ncbi:hypothetical protein Phum_PHUM615950 [Pediculus humanus corporis]|uniref:Uncharacterized protein n=1 Tax=Pediculus humanus subsp. corporis TaxID=121224 RepID=E0W464_PEDHC|nr:uncharacterized protein Phum_PHUM615950 [Pediculus humanus corporis]EEB20420.1 hypothetical protein Phum_PHUM615950 [Pediculus humanus corporis]